jgi:hypothetical protein
MMNVGRSEILRIEELLRKLISEGKPVQVAIDEIQKQGIGKMNLIDPLMSVTGLDRTETLRLLSSPQRT